MSTPRHRAREAALQILYRYDVAMQSPTGSPPPEGSALLAELQSHFDHFQVTPPLREFAAELVAGTLRDLKEIDALIEKHAANWKLSRMSLVDRNLLRMATYELQHFSDIPRAATINEAVELGKQFGTAETPSFVNGILDAVAAAIESAKSSQS